MPLNEGKVFVLVVLFASQMALTEWNQFVVCNPFAICSFERLALEGLHELLGLYSSESAPIQ